MDFKESLRKLAKLALAPIERESESWLHLENEWIEIALTDGPRALELAKDPTYYFDNEYAVCAIADKSQVDRFFRTPKDVTVIGGPRNWPPLLYVCFSRINDIPG